MFISGFFQQKRSKIHALFSRIFRIDYTSGNQIKIQTKKETSTNSCHFMPHTTCGFFYSMSVLSVPVSSTIAPDRRPCGCSPRPVYAAKPGVHRFLLFPHTRAEDSPRRAAVSVNAGIRRRYGAWIIRTVSTPAVIQQITSGIYRYSSHTQR